MTCLNTGKTMKYIPLFLLLVCCGCSDSVTVQPNAKAVPEPAATPEPVETAELTATPEPWGGLVVETRGVPLEDSTQVVVLLHGYGASGADLVSFADQLAAEGRAFVFPAAPVKLDAGGLAWATLQSEIETSLESLQNLISYIHQTYPDSEISVGGFSQGASMSSMLLKSETPIHHAILFSPGLFLRSIDKTSGASPTVYISHGRDDKILPFSDAQKLKRMLSDAGFNVELSAFDGGHTIPAKALKEAKIQLDDAR